MENVRTSLTPDNGEICQVSGNLGHSRDCLAIPQSVNHLTDTGDALETQEQEALCPVCDQPTKDNSIECDQCEKFVHFFCENIDERILEQANKNNEYICSSCHLKNIERIEEEEQRKLITTIPGTEDTETRDTDIENSQTLPKQPVVSEKSNNTQQEQQQRQHQPQPTHQEQQQSLQLPQTTELSQNQQEKTGKKKTPRGSNNQPRKSNNSIKHDCIETERKIALLQEEVARLEDIILVVEQKNTIRIHKMRAANVYCNNQEPANNNSALAQTNIIERMRDIEIENLRTRIAIIEMESKMKPQTNLCGSQRTDTSRACSRGINTYTHRPYQHHNRKERNSFTTKNRNPYPSVEKRKGQDSAN